MGIGFDETSMTGVMRHQIAGDLIIDGDPGYNEARRVWNSMIDRRPRAIIRASAASALGRPWPWPASMGCGWPSAAAATAWPATGRWTGAWSSTWARSGRSRSTPGGGSSASSRGRRWPTGGPAGQAEERLTGPGRRCLPDLVPGQRRVMPHDERMAAWPARPMSGMPAKGPWELAIVYRGSV